MTAEEVKKLLNGNDKKIANVKITSKGGKEFKMSLRINPSGMLCIGSYKSKAPNYHIGDTVTDNWESVELI